MTQHPHEYNSRMYQAVLKTVMQQGSPVNVVPNTATGEKEQKVVATLEVANVTANWDMSYPVVSVVERKLNYQFMYAEAAWIISGSDKAEDILPYCKQLEAFLDAGCSAFYGAYGIPIANQVDYIVDTLTKHPTSRRAVLTIWRQNPAVSKDIPCTLSMQFFLRGGQINTTVCMRSSDAFLGLPYDVFNFSMITAWVAMQLKQVPRMGILTLNIGSQHIYANDFNKIKDIAVSNNIQEFDGLDLVEFNTAGQIHEHLVALRDDQPTIFNSVTTQQDGRNQSPIIQP